MRPFRQESGVFGRLGDRLTNLFGAPKALEYADASSGRWWGEGYEVRARAPLQHGWCQVMPTCPFGIDANCPLGTMRRRLRHG